MKSSIIFTGISRYILNNLTELENLKMEKLSRPLIKKHLDTIKHICTQVNEQLQDFLNK